MCTPDGHPNMTLQAVEVNPRAGMNAHALHPSSTCVKHFMQHSWALALPLMLNFQPPATPEMPIQFTFAMNLAGLHAAMLGVWSTSVSIASFLLEENTRPYS